MRRMKYLAILAWLLAMIYHVLQLAFVLGAKQERLNGHPRG